MSQKITFSIIIPVKNGIATIRQCLDAISSQTLIDQTEVIVIDSGSTDGTLTILKEYPVRLYQIHPQDFNHGETRNYGVSLAKGEFVMMTVQDAWSEDKLIFQRMLAHFSNPNVVGVCGQQIVPHNDSMNPLRWFKPASIPIPVTVNFQKKEDFERLSPISKSKAAGWDNVIAMYRKKYLIEHPFIKTNYSEDLRWAIESLRNGATLVYDYRNRVFHYHHSAFKYNFKRRFIENTQRFWCFGIKPSPIRSFLKSIKRLIYAILKENLKLKWLLHNISLTTSSLFADFFTFGLSTTSNTLLNCFYRILSRDIPQGKSNG